MRHSVVSLWISDVGAHQSSCIQDLEEGLSTGGGRRERGRMTMEISIV
jgi:hypothetical protein